MATPQEMLDRLITALGLANDSQLAKRLGVNRSTVGGWRSRGTIPITYFIRCAEEENLSLDWLLLGEGERSRPSHQDNRSTARATGQLHSAWEAEGEALGSALGLGKRAVLARLGRTKQIWAILEALIEAGESGATLDELSQTTGLGEDQMLTYVSLLVEGGLIEEVARAGSRFYLKAPAFSELKSGDRAEFSQLSIEVVRQLLDVVVPAVERKEGRISLGFGHVASGRSAELAADLIDTARARCQATTNDPSEEKVVVIIGVARAD